MNVSRFANFITYTNLLIPVPEVSKKYCNFLTFQLSGAKLKSREKTFRYLYRLRDLINMCFLLQLLTMNRSTVRYI